MYSKQSLFKTYVIIRYAFIAMLSRQKSAKIYLHTLLFPNPIMSCLAWFVIWLAIIIRSLITVRKRLCLTSLFCLGARLPSSAPTTARPFAGMIRSFVYLTIVIKYKTFNKPRYCRHFRKS